MVEFGKWIKGFNYEKEENGTQEMSVLRQGDEQKEIWQAIRGLHNMEKAEVLQPVVREPSKILNEKRLQLEGEEIPKRELRGMPEKGAPSCSSSGRGYNEQQTREHSNSLHSLSQVSPRYGREAWINGSWESGIARVAIGIAHRVDRIKALGNGQVPIVDAAAWNLLIKGDDNAI